MFGFIRKPKINNTVELLIRRGAGWSSDYNLYRINKRNLKSLVKLDYLHDARSFADFCALEWHKLTGIKLKKGETKKMIINQVDNGFIVTFEDVPVAK